MFGEGVYLGMGRHALVSGSSGAVATEACGARRSGAELQLPDVTSKITSIAKGASPPSVLTST
jgi:hypothetical protein